VLLEVAQLTCGSAPAILCCQELRVRAEDEADVGRMRAALDGYACHAALPRDPRNVRYRGGRAYGVATWVRAELDARGERPPWDREGRLVLVVLERQRLVVANVYGVNGTARPYFDPTLGREAGDRHAFKQRFQRLLAAACASWQARGYRLVVIGDWNVAREQIDAHPRLRSWGPHAQARRQLNDELMPALDLVDVFRLRHPSARAYTWYSRWSTALDAARVDFALVSRALADAVVDVAIGPRPPPTSLSDHAPLWLTLRL
jgi:exodeoxyribonuclease-3